MTTAKRSRIYFYLIISVLVNLLNFLKELQDDSLADAIYETIILFPFTFLLCFATYFSRKVFLKFIKKQDINKIQKYIWWSSFILLQTCILSIGINYATYLLFSKTDRPLFLDIIFWAIIIVTFFVTLFVYFLEFFLESEQEKQAIALQLIMHDREKSIAKYLALKKQLNPHFLFNSFNSLLGLIGKDPEKAELFVSELSNVYRYNLIKNEEIVVPLKHELEMITSYFYLQKIRFADSIILQNTVDSATLHMLIPPMTLELLIENAIKHNSIEKQAPLHITIYTEKEYVCVANNYQPRKGEQYNIDSLGIGIKNLTDQLKLLQDKTPTFMIKNGFYIAKIPLIQPEL